MSPILVLVPDRDGAPAREQRRVEMCRGVMAEVADEATYSSVIVVNDGGADTVRRLLMALDMRQRRKSLCVGVLTYLEAQNLDRASQDLRDLRPVPLQSGSPLSALLDCEARLRIDLKDDALSFEYQTV